MKHLRASVALLLVLAFSPIALGSSKYGPTSGGGGGGGGAVSSVSAGSGCASISPTTGAVVITTSGCLTLSNNLSDLPSVSTARTNLGLGTLSTQNGTFSGTSSGTNTGDQTITLTGAVTGSGTGSFTTTIAAGSIALSKVATQADQTVLLNISGGVASPIAGTASQLRTLVAYDLGTVQTVSGSAVTNIDFTGLSGDTDGDYEITAYINLVVAGGITLQPNLTVTTNQEMRGWYTNGAGAIGNQGAVANLTFVNNPGTATPQIAKATLWSKTARGPRMYEVSVYDVSNHYVLSAAGVWNESATAITGMRFAGPTNGIGVGSWVRVRKLYRN